MVFGGSAHDVGCSDCECTVYRRVNAGTPEAQAAAMTDTATYAIIVQREARRRVRYLTWLRVTLLAAVWVMVVSILFPVPERLAFLLIGVLGVIFLAAAVSEFRVGELRMALVDVLQGVLAFVVAVTLTMTGPLWVFCVIGAFALAAMILHFRSSNRFLKAAFAELERYRADGFPKS